MRPSFLLKRTVASIGILFGVSIMVFGAIRLVPGDPVSLMLGKSDQANPELVAEFRRSYGLDDPLPIQYFRWVTHAISGDFGRSLDTRERVGDVLQRRLSATLVLSSIAALIALAVGLLWGVVAAYARGAIGALLRSAPLVFMSVPPFAYGIALGYVLAVWLRVLPSSGMTSPVDGGGVIDVLHHAVLPAVTLAIIPASLTARITAGTLDELRHEDFVRTALAAGIPERRVALRHVLPNALLPVVTNSGVLVGYMFTSAVLVEAVFSWPGVGTMMIHAVENRDYPVLQAGAFIVASVFVLVNWVVDALYGIIDPRIR